MTSTLEFLLTATDKTKPGMDSAGKNSDSLSGKLKGVAVAAGGIYAARKVLDLGEDLVAAGETASTSNSRIEQVNVSMGLFGAQTDEVSKRLENLANKTAMNDGVDQNQIKLTQAKLLTFKDLAQSADTMGGNFDRATQAAIDMGAAGFGDAASNAVQLGKALQDPIKGITALAKSGVTFTDAEKAQIQAMVDAGDAAGAQNLVLKAIEAQVGGTAQATANGSDKMRIGWSQLQEKVGLDVLPVFDKLVEVGLKVTDWLTNTPGAMPAVGIGLGIITVAMVAAKLATIAWSESLYANPIVWIAAIAVAAIAGIVLAVKNWGAIVDWLKGVWGGISGWFHDKVLGPIEDAWTQMPARLATVGKAIANVLTWPIRAQWNGLADIWNATIGKIHVTVPSWVPGVGGKDFSLPQLGHIPSFATGVTNFGGGLARINENGPELVQLPAGSSVYPAGDSAPVQLRREDLDYLANRLAQLMGIASRDAAARTLRTALR